MAGSGPPHSIHSVGSEHAVFVWHNAADPVLEIESGLTLEPQCADASTSPTGVVGAFLHKAMLTL